MKMLLGEPHELEVKQLKGTLTRFGITEKLADISSDTAVMRLGSIVPDGVAKVVFRNRATGTALEFGFDIYRGGAASSVPPQFRVIRLRSQRFSIDMSMHNDSMNIFFHAKEEVESDIADLLKHYKLIKMMTRPSDVDISIQSDGKTLNGKLNGTGFEGDFDDSIDMLEAANYLKTFYDYHEPLKVAPNWFARNGHILVSHATFLKNVCGLKKVVIEFTLADGDEDLKDAECIVAMPVVIGELCFVGLFVYGGQLNNKGGGTYEIIPNKVEVIYKTQFTVEYLASGNAVRDLEQAVDRYEGAETIVPFIDKYMEPVVESAKRALGKEQGPR
ncbi:hypothetical protein OGV25_00405 [Pseudomonas sp. P1B16]|uniref:hypothetical protein n=1 Tax=Pseudomonas sp. P1B16 TaxID=2986074 RepID=UPI002A239DDC|nr:hypothetical protein [Pseudomonas sp. P1B16]WPM26846.1 hypothetical protein OGV25_00405 [Pseudomonas sp. P1B16]